MNNSNDLYNYAHLTNNLNESKIRALKQILDLTDAYTKPNLLNVTKERLIEILKDIQKIAEGALE